MSGRVIWTNRARCAALAVPCRTCNVTIGQDCIEWDRKAQKHIACDTHLSRADYAEVLGFRDVADPGPLFELSNG